MASQAASAVGRQEEYLGPFREEVGDMAAVSCLPYAVGNAGAEAADHGHGRRRWEHSRHDPCFRCPCRCVRTEKTHGAGVEPEGVSLAEGA